MDILHYLINFFSGFGYLAVFVVLVLCGFGIPLPEDVTLVAGGVICALSLTANHHLNYHIMILVSFFGVVVGDGIMFALGRMLGPKVTRIPLIKMIMTPRVYIKMQGKAKKYGNKILFVARFLPGLRAPIFLTAGVSHKVSPWRFLLMDTLAALISVPVWVYLGYLFAYDLDRVLAWVSHSEMLVVIIALIIVAFIFVYHKYIKTKQIKSTAS